MEASTQLFPSCLAAIFIVTLSRLPGLFHQVPFARISTFPAPCSSTRMLPTSAAISQLKVELSGGTSADRREASCHAFPHRQIQKKTHQQLTAQARHSPENR